MNIRPLIFLLLLVGAAVLEVACSKQVDEHRGDLAKHGGSPTVRVPYERAVDDPSTTNDESNDQPVGHFGSVTLQVTSEDSGNTYTLDAEVDGTTVDRVYFPKGGWVDFYDCELDEDLTGDCEDEEGRWWTIGGESLGAPDAFVDDEEDDEDYHSDDDESSEEDEN